MNVKRMKYLVKIFSLLLILGVWSCGNRKPDYDKRLVAAHELLKSNADSAFRVLNQMNVNDFETEHDRAYYAYNYTVALDWLNVHSVDDSLLKVAIDYYSAHGDSAMKAKVYYYAADVYDDMGDREQAICYYNKALEVAPIDSVILKASIYSKWTFHGTPTGEVNAEESGKICMGAGDDHSKKGCTICSCGSCCWSINS